MTDRRRRAMQFVVLMGVVSLFADMCYEGMRSGVGQFLGLLGASGALVGFIGGLGEAIGYGLRYVTGRIVDRTHAYWGMAIAGYALTGLAVPALALAPAAWTVALLVAFERLGKAVRNPARSTLLSFAGEEIGAGWTFGLHQALDQTGAVLGPLLLTAVVWWRGNDDASAYRWGFAALAIPAAITIAIVVAARFRYPDPQSLRPETPPDPTASVGALYRRYLVGAALMAAGLADWALLAFHLGGSGAVPLHWLAVVYAGAMGTEAIASLVVGRLYDRIKRRTGSGVGVLAAVALIGAAYAPLVFATSSAIAYAGVALWAATAAATESIGKAVVSQLTPAASRGRAFGGYYAVFGIAWWLGSVTTGALYDRSPTAAAGFASACMVAAAAVLFSTSRAVRAAARG
jgi:MFS family permease